MTQPAGFARHSRHLQLTATLRAYHAHRLIQRYNGRTEIAMHYTQYPTVKAMRRAIRRYVKSPASTAIEDGAQTK